MMRLLIHLSPDVLMASEAESRFLGDQEMFSSLMD
jgi:hypothetical protein